MTQAPQGPKKKPKRKKKPNRSDPEKAREQVRAANRAVYRANQQMHAEDPVKWERLLAKAYEAEGVDRTGPNRRTDPDRAAKVAQQERERAERRRERERKYDLTGRVFGRLTVQKRGRNTAPTPSEPSGVVQWWCRCECGTRKLVRAHSLVGGHTKSCGCLRAKEKKKKRRR